MRLVAKWWHFYKDRNCLILFISEMVKTKMMQDEMQNVSTVNFLHCWYLDQNITVTCEEFRWANMWWLLLASDIVNQASAFNIFSWFQKPIVGVHWSRIIQSTYGCYLSTTVILTWEICPVTSENKVVKSFINCLFHDSCWEQPQSWNDSLIAVK